MKRKSKLHLSTAPRITGHEQRVVRRGELLLNRFGAFGSLRTWILILIFLVPIVPFVVIPSMIFPFVTGKSFVFRIIVELMFALYVVLALSDATYRPRQTFLSSAVLAFAGVILVADLCGENAYRSFWSTYERMEGFVTIGHVVCFYFVARTVLDSDLWWRRFWNTSIVASTLIATYGLLQYAGWLAIYSGGERIDATLNNASFLAAYLLFHVFLVGLFLLHSRRPIWTGVYSGMLILLCAALFLTATRSAILGLMVGAIVSAALLLFDRRQHIGVRRTSFALLASIFAVFVLFAALKDTTAVHESPVLTRFASLSLSDFQDESRYRIWSVAIRAIADKPLLGWGQENFNYAFNRHFDPHIDAEEQWFDRAHNAPLDWLIAGGIAGFLAFVTVFAAMLFCLWRKNAFDGITRSLITGLLAAYAIHNLFAFDNLVSYTLIFALLAFVDRRSLEPRGASIAMPSKQHTHPVSYAATICLSLSTIVVVYFVNVPAMRSAVILMQATSLQPEGLEKNMKLFKDALAIKSLGNNEAVEQLVNVTTEVTGSNAPVALKSSFYLFSAVELNAMAYRETADARYTLLAGTFFNHYRQYEAAIPHLENAVAESPSRTAAHEELGKAYLGTGNYERAFREFSAGHALQPQFPDANSVYASDQTLTMRETESDPRPESVAVVEYGDAVSGRYMVTASGEEALAIDAGAQIGWTRTGNTWRAWASSESNRDLVPVCRFYGPMPALPAYGYVGTAGHYFTADPAECEARRAALPERSRSASFIGEARFEGVAFFVQLPESGICPLGTTPIYRMRKYDRGAAANDRFIATLATKRDLTANGWLMEPKLAAFMCGAPAINLQAIP